MFKGFSGAFSAEFFEIELVLSGEPVFVATFSPAADAEDGVPPKKWTGIKGAGTTSLHQEHSRKKET